MSLSKQTPTDAAADRPRQPKCTRCRHHGIVVPQKGHTKLCPFLKCDCWKCFLITERTRITALQRSLKGAQGGGRRASDRAGDGPGTPAAPGPAAESPPAAGGEREAGEALPPGEKRGNDAPYLGELRQPARLPLIHLPFRMLGHYPSSYAPCPNIMLNMQWLPPVPAGLFNPDLCGPLTFPYVHQGAVHYPPPPEPAPPAECRQVYFTLQPPPVPEAFQEELMPRQHPQPPLVKNTEPDVVELD